MSHPPTSLEDVTIPLRERSGTSAQWGEKKRMNPTPGVRFLSLEVRDSLPELCSEHGITMSEKRSGVVRFHQTERGREQWTPRSVLRKLAHDLFFNWAYPALDVCASLYGEWPLCTKCVQRQRRLRRIGRGLLLLGPVLLTTAIAARIADYKILYVPLFVAFFPFWLPGGALAALLTFGAAQRFVRCRPLADGTTVTLHSHPDFAAAVRDSGC